jgi:hypothetical protein
MRKSERERKKELSEQKHKQQFSVQKKQQQQRFGIYEHKNRRKNNMNFIQEEFHKNNGNV